MRGNVDTSARGKRSFGRLPKKLPRSDLPYRKKKGQLSMSRVVPRCGPARRHCSAASAAFAGRPRFPPRRAFGQSYRACCDNAPGMLLSIPVARGPCPLPLLKKMFSTIRARLKGPQRHRKWLQRLHRKWQHEPTKQFEHISQCSIKLHSMFNDLQNQAPGSRELRICKNTSAGSGKN